jgi:hypothetical protein
MLNFFTKKIRQEGLSLIVVIFVMMILAVLGWSLATMLATDFQANMRSFNSERALYLAEAGKEWGLRMVLSNSSWNTSSDRDCNHTNEWLLHNLSAGQYEVCCRGNQSSEDAFTVLEVTGYVPTKANYLAMRKTKFFLNTGGFRYVVQARDLFDWSRVNKTAGDSYYNGSIQCGHYDGDGDGIYDELGIDYRGPPNELPADNSTVNHDRFLAAEPFPGINMDYYRTQAAARGSDLWPDNWVASEAQIQGFHTHGGLMHIVVNASIFSGAKRQWGGNIIRDISGARNWSDADLSIIHDREDYDEVSLESSPVWQVGDIIRIGRRLSSDTGDSLMYVRGDVLLDARTNPVWMYRTSVVAEGDIAIRGTNAVTFTDRPLGFPSLGTENGNITSLELPNGSNNAARRASRDFDNAIYSKNGTVEFNYLNGEAVIGKRVILHNSTRLNYDPQISALTGFGWGVAKRDWQEQ